MLRFPSIDKTRGVGDAWSAGADNVYVDPVEVIAIEPAFHDINSWRPPQFFSRIYLRSGAMLEVFRTADHVMAEIEDALTALQANRPDPPPAPEAPPPLERRTI